MKNKMNIRKILLGIATVAALGLLVATAVVSAYQGDPTKQGPNFDADLHDLKTEAFAAQDYAVWKDLMEQSGARGRVLDVVNEDNFDIFVQARDAALEGDLDLAQELRAEIGLNGGYGPHDGSDHMGLHKEGVGGRQGMRGQGMHADQENFIDSDGAGVCDNLGSRAGQSQRMGRQ